jgi:NAD(P) transhydrogenase subunit beta
METLETVVRYTYLAAAACFVLGLHLMNTPATARRGNLLSGGAMAVAVVATAVLLISRGGVSLTGWIVMILAGGIGSAFGVYAARSVQMTAMPQLVSLFNAVGGGAAALLAITHLLVEDSHLGARFSVPAGLDILIGSVALTGSLVAAGKLQG